MPFEMPGPGPRRIAVIGGGISGMAAAHLLSADHAVVLFESETRLGGHARTIIAGKRGDQPVDTGFIVFNHVNYPRLTALFDRLNVPTVPTKMSFGCSIDGGRVEYGLADFSTIFAQKQNLARPAFLRMLRDILHFNKHALAASARNPNQSIADMLDDLGTGPWFRDYYITPFSGAIWSTPLAGILDFPAHALVQFFKNHGLLGYAEQHQWHTVQGGSVEYVRRLQARMAADGVELRLGAKVAGVQRIPQGVMLRSEGGEWETFDDLVFACHSDQALAMLTDATPAERSALSAVRYQPNQAVLHSDAGVMPKRRKVWSSWAYVEPTRPSRERIDLSYWMNSLQPIPMDDPLFVTLNTNRAIPDHLVHDVATFHHPVFDLAALKAQQTIKAMNGTGRTWFCGAWMGHGFHEDGFASAEAVAQGIAARQARISAVAAE
jgi:uncharacterized protein